MNIPWMMAIGYVVGFTICILIGSVWIRLPQSRRIFKYLTIEIPPIQNVWDVLGFSIVWPFMMLVLIITVIGVTIVHRLGIGLDWFGTTIANQIMHKKSPAKKALL